MNLKNLELPRDGRQIDLGDIDAVDASLVEGEESEVVPTGDAAASLLSAGIGAFTLGLLTVLASLFKPIADMLTLGGRTDTLAPRATVAVLAWLGVWCVLHFAWKARQMDVARPFLVGLILLALGLVGTLPAFYEPFLTR